MKHPLSLSELTQRGDPLGDYIDFMSRNLLSAAERSTLDCRLAKIDREKFGDAESFAVAMNAFRIKMRVLSKIEPEKFRSIKVWISSLRTLPTGNEVNSLASCGSNILSRDNSTSATTMYRPVSCHGCQRA
jgi:hypothetical protein